MADIFTPERRKEIMASIRGKNTKPERLVFSHLRRNKVYFQRHYKRAAGCPDVALPRKKRAVFIDGDFWHGRNFEKRRPSFESNGQDFWIKKIERNIKKDVEVIRSLEESGWRILRVWETELMRKRDREATLGSIVAFLTAESEGA